ncbi:MAG: NAD(P)-dependent oxidoreductase [Verrucomicrobiales bacterium]|nr:NAD(P)-dependent oxidoreductase [Verrucomicrobiales bacterium]
MAGSTSTQEAVGVIGLGIIGSRVAENVRSHGARVYVWSRRERPVANFLATPAEVAEQAEVIQIFVRDGRALLEMLDAMQPALTKRHLVMNHATVLPADAREAARRCEACGAGFLDAPFTGSKNAAAAGKLCYYVAGPETLRRRALPILRWSGEKILPMGEVGDASVVKIATNLVTAAIVKALAEAASITRAEGVDLLRLKEAFENNANYSPLIGMKLPAMMAGDFEAHFSLDNMLKDVDFGLQLAAGQGVAAPVIAAAADGLRERLQAGEGDLDFAVVGRGVAPGGNL